MCRFLLYSTKQLWPQSMVPRLLRVSCGVWHQWILWVLYIGGWASMDKACSSTSHRCLIRLISGFNVVADWCMYHHSLFAMSLNMHCEDGSFRIIIHHSKWVILGYCFILWHFQILILCFDFYCISMHMHLLCTTIAQDHLLIVSSVLCSVCPLCIWKTVTNSLYWWTYRLTTSECTVRLLCQHGCQRLNSTNSSNNFLHSFSLDFSLQLTLLCLASYGQFRSSGWQLYLGYLMSIACKT